MNRLQLWIAVAVMVAGVVAAPVAAFAQPAEAAHPGEVFKKYVAAVQGKKYAEAGAYMAPMSERLLLILLAARTANTPQLAADADTILQKHNASGLKAVEGTIEGIAPVLKNWDSQFGSIKEPHELLADFAELGDAKGMPLVQALPPGATVELGDYEQRGNLAWVTLLLNFNGEIHNGMIVCLRVDGEWKLLVLNNVFRLLALEVIGRQVASAAAFDVIALKSTRDWFATIADAIRQNREGQNFPGTNRAPSTADLVGLVGDGTLPADAIAKGANDTAEFVDAWGKPVHYSASEGTATLRSAGFDGQLNTEDDVVSRIAANADANATALPRVRVKTNKGEFVLELFEDAAPNAVANFITLVEQGFYDGTKFHRIVDGFMIQGGDANTRTGQGMPGTGDAGYSLPDEYTPNHTFDAAGILAYANSGPDTSSCQFFVTLDATPHLDDRIDPRSGRQIHYTILGRVVSGMDVITAIGKTRVGQSMNGEPSRPLEDVTIEKAEVINKRPGSYPVRKLDR